MNKKNMIVTLGMHRSGTSAITRGLEVLGVSLGEKLMSGVKDINDKGFFEDVDLVKINMVLMKELGIDWDSLSAVDFDRLGEATRDRLERACQGFLLMRSGQHKRYGIKDPRLCRLLPFWQLAFERTGVQAKGVIALRNPVSVAASLSRRDGFPPVKSFYLWLRHVLESLVHSQWMAERVVVDYDLLMQDPLGQVERVSQQLGLKINRHAFETYQSEFLDEGLRHFVSDEDWENADVPVLVRKTYDLLVEVARDRYGLESDSFQQQLAQILSEYRGIESLLDYCAKLELGEGSSQAGVYALGGQKSVFLNKGETTSFSVSASNQIVPKSLSSRERLQQWLELRAPSPAERAHIERMKSDYARWPAIHVVVIAQDDREPGSLEKTMASLTRMEQHVLLDGTVLALGDSLNGEAISDKRFRTRSIPENRLPDVLNDLCREGDFDWLLPVRAGSEFVEWGLLRLSLELLGVDGVNAVFGDELIQTTDDELGTGFRPDFNLDLLLSYPSAVARNWLFDRKSLLRVGGFEGANGLAAELGLILRMVEMFGFAGLAHAAEPLVVDGMPQAAMSDEPRVIETHLKNRGYEKARVEPGIPGTWKLQYGHQQTPLVSIVIITRDNIQALQRCVETLLEETAYKQFEILIVDQDSQSREARVWLDGLADMGLDQVRVLKWQDGRNYSAMRNWASSEARGEYLVFLSDSAAIIHSDWLSALMNHSLRPEVGVVGAKLLSPSGKIQHAGEVLGLRGGIGRPFIGEELNAPGYMYRLQVDQNYSAVSADCLMVRKSLFDQVGGLDEGALQDEFAGVDLCLKAREAGFLTVWTPHSIVMNAHEPSVDDTEVGEIDEPRMAREDALYAKWLPVLANDPSYNRNLSLQGQGFDLEARLARVPKPVDIGPDTPRVLVHNADPWGCGHYRIIQPFEAMRRSGLMDGWQSQERLQLSEVARLAPDSVVLQRQTSEHAIQDMRRMKQYANRFMVYELDDYLPNLPIKSAYREHMPRDILKSLRRAVQWCDRFVVSTTPLAEALDGLHPDIRVVENLLPGNWWQGLQGHRRKGDKPRVGWAGSKGHTGDLEMIADVIAHFANDVDWIFFGMCPDRLRPYARELHDGVEISSYPAKLASLDLDLAIAPLEDNLFNQCKSNLKLLEYGACGFPVVCSDVAPYRAHGLPVTRVRNRFKDWVDAIQDHISDLDETARLGDRLQQVIHCDWMLEGPRLESWLDHWVAR